MKEAPPLSNREVPVQLYKLLRKSEYAETNSVHFLYKLNNIISSRYTMVDFLPKALLEQFRRLANVYFLVIGGIAVIGEYTGAYNTAVLPIGILGPMVLVVMISVIKDGVEDIKRHQQDSKIDSKLCWFLSRTFISE